MDTPDCASPSILLLLLGIPLLWAGCASTSEGLVTLKIQDRERSYIVHAPRGREDSPGLPLLLVLHGGGGTAKGMVDLTKKGFNAIADREGAWVVYPQGWKKHWNDRRLGSRSKAHTENVDDVGFLEAVIRLMIEEHRIDRSRIFMTGLSNGGIMSFRMALEKPDLLRAIAPVAACLPENFPAEFSHRGRTSLALINGTRDPVIPYEGGPIQILWSRRGKVVSTDRTLAFWIRHVGLHGKPVTAALPDRDPEDKTRVFRTDAGKPSGEPRVVLYKVEGGGHTWPGGDQYLGEWIIGKTSKDLDACEEIWRFFSRFSTRRDP